MIKTSDNRLPDQVRRLEMKSQDQRLRSLAVQGAGISPWEADILVDVVKEVYLAEPDFGPLRSGQTRFECVAIGEGAGKPIRECRMATVVLTLLDLKEDQSIGMREGATALRRHRIQRMTEEAREQKGLLSQEDLALLLSSDVRTIRRDIQFLRVTCGILVATRGQIQDIGPGVTHKAVAIKHWLNGQDPVDVAKDIHHSLNAVERYIHTFSRCVFLRRKGFHEVEIALTVGISSAGVRTYLDIYESQRGSPEYAYRFQEIDLIGASHFEAEDAKKGGPSRPLVALSAGWRRP